MFTGKYGPLFANSDFAFQSADEDSECWFVQMDWKFIILWAVRIKATSNGNKYCLRYFRIWCFLYWLQCCDERFQELFIFAGRFNTLSEAILWFYLNFSVS